ncbi:hypothetical protein PC116_g2186 [Phytophthora cactorum]|nr:hypothetical protein PC123_g8816 [Phytophthora cactorum]KAG4250141.1 hypothetical protein PC116_g2186 [Phytophthora cactorum]
MNGGPLRETEDKQTQLRRACLQTDGQWRRALILSVALRHATAVSSIHRTKPVIGLDRAGRIPHYLFK